MTVSSYGAVIVPQEAVIVGEADGRFRLSAAGEAYEVTYLLVYERQNQASDFE